MVTFTELKISNGYLNIKAAVKDLSYYTDVYISDLYIDTQDTFVSGGPSGDSSCVKHITYNTSDLIKSIDESINIFDKPVDIENDIFFIYVKCTGEPSPYTPCGMDNEVTAGATTNFSKLYRKGLVYLKELSDTCNIPSGFIDFILKFKAFTLSLQTCDFIQAIKFWKKFFVGNSIVSKGCGCHGSSIN